MCPQMNLCKMEVMSVCTAENMGDQKKCRFYEQSIQMDRCMYFIFNKYCDSVKAQMSDR